MCVCVHVHMSHLFAMARGSRGLSPCPLQFKTTTVIFLFVSKLYFQIYSKSCLYHFTFVQARFAKPVLPGQSLRTDMWKEGSRVYFRTVVVETDTPCLTGGYVDLREGGARQEQTAPSATPPKVIRGNIISV